MRKQENERTNERVNKQVIEGDKRLQVFERVQAYIFITIPGNLMIFRFSSFAERETISRIRRVNRKTCIAYWTPHSLPLLLFYSKSSEPKTSSFSFVHRKLNTYPTLVNTWRKKIILPFTCANDDFFWILDKIVNWHILKWTYILLKCQKFFFHFYRLCVCVNDDMSRLSIDIQILMTGDLIIFYFRGGKNIRDK